jgi:hypothetical protein
VNVVEGAELFVGDRLHNLLVNRWSSVRSATFRGRSARWSTTLLWTAAAKEFLDPRIRGTLGSLRFHARRHVWSRHRLGHHPVSPVRANASRSTGSNDGGIAPFQRPAMSTMDAPVSIGCGRNGAGPRCRSPPARPCPMSMRG